MKEPIQETNPQTVKRIRFGVYSPQQIQQMSVLELHQRDLFDITNTERRPAIGGVLDNRLGTPDKTALCETCGEGMQQCVGHFGSVRLVMPVFHIGYYKLMMTILQNICKHCSRVLVDEKVGRGYLKKLRMLNLDGVNRKNILKSLNTLCKKTGICPHCSNINGMVKKVGPLKVIHEKFKKKSKAMALESANFMRTFDGAVQFDPYLKNYVSKACEDLNPLIVQGLFERITALDCEMMGLDPANARPELFIWTALPIPPICIRPSVGQETSSTEDDLTILASEIIDVNTKMKTCMLDGTPTAVLMEFWDFLQLQCAMYITSDLPGIPSHLQINLNKIKKGFCQRLKGKQGRFRGNLSGKRVDFSGRTVISPDPNLKIDQVAVPERVCKILTYPERVTQFNLSRLQQNIRNGPDVHPGATYLTQQNGLKRFLKYGDSNKTAEKLAIGDVVDRHLQDGDVVLFNRQPSLHKLSIMSHFVKVRPWRTFRFNECVCAPYNADFDGDEMNLHVPQTEEARAEAINLMGVQHNIVTPRNGEPLIAATQDFITASYLLSLKDVFFDRSQFVQICGYLSDGRDHVSIPMPSILKPVRLWSGKQVFSVLMFGGTPCSKKIVQVNLRTKCRTFDQKSINHLKLDSSMCSSDGYLVIHNSELLCGVIDKAIIGDGNKNSLFYVIQHDYGTREASECMNKVAKLSARWLANRGFSIGIDDVQPGAGLRREKRKTVDKGYFDCDETIRQAKEGTLEKQAGMDTEGTVEANLSGILSRIRDDVGTVCFSELNKYNAPLIMSLCGSKGSKINVSQMVACVGQQIISGSRIPNGFGDRSLPHFPRNSKTPAAKGFVGSSFYSGLSPTEFLFHAVSGREGLVDTAVKTAETGYMSRRLMKALEDLACCYDLSVRDSVGGVVQFKYGDDGLDPVMIEGGLQPVDFARTLLHVKSVRKQKEISLSSSKEKKEESIVPLGSLLSKEKKEGSIVPLGTPKEKKEKKEKEEKKEEGLELVTLGKEKVRKGCKEMRVESYKEIEREISKRSDGSQSKLFIQEVQQFLSAYIISNQALSEDLHAEGLGREDLITFEQLERFLNVTFQKYQRAIIEPGTAVGAIGAQSIGEPGTQMTLKTFHFAGVASMNITLGVPRIKEIINASKKISTPVITAPLVYKGLGAETAARVVKGRIEMTLLKDVLMRVQEVVSSDELLLMVKVNIDAINRLHLEVDIDSIKWAIVKATKIRDIKIESQNTLRIAMRTYTQLHTIKRMLPSIVIKGLPLASRAVITSKLDLLVEGYGLLQVMGTAGVDGLNCTSNHILEMQSVLGIESARQTIILEILKTMSSHGMTIDPRHVMLLGDLMSFKGEILGITRFGIAKMKDSVLMLASFEKTTDHLFEAAFYGREDLVKGVSESIIMGVPMTVGTGMFAVVQEIGKDIGLGKDKGKGKGKGKVQKVEKVRRDELVWKSF